MTSIPPDSEAEPEVDETYSALVHLRGLAGRLPGVDPDELRGIRRMSPGEALHAVAKASQDDVPISARLDLLYDLAGAELPEMDKEESEYSRLLSSIAKPLKVDPDSLLDDLKKSALEKSPFALTDTGQLLEHHVAAFVGEDVCTTRPVTVNGESATWIFSEFETDAPYDKVVGWVDPHSWPKRGPLLFKSMEPVAGPTNIRALSNQHWHGVFREEVQLVRRVRTDLHCDYWQNDPGTSAGMTYELAFSIDGEIRVDRGFLLVNDVGPYRRVKALKIVGFTEVGWDQVAMLVCPAWTDWVRKAVEGGSSSTPKPPGEGPAGGTPITETVNAWLDFLQESGRTYLDLFDDVSSRATPGDYTASDWLDDGRKYWSQLAKDWAQAWRYGSDLLQEVVEQGLDASLMPPGRPVEPGRGIATFMTATRGVSPSWPIDATIIPIPGLGEGDPLECSPLVSIEANGPKIEASTISATALRLDPGTFGVRLTTSAAGAPPGLYVGEIRHAEQVTPVQLYLSRARDPNEGD